MKRGWKYLWEQVKGFAVFALMVPLAPLLVVRMWIQQRRERPLVARLRRDRVDDLRVVADELVITRAGAIEKVPLAELTLGEWMLVDHGGAFASANECAVLFDFPRRGGEPLALALQYYLPHHPESLVRPLQARGLLPELAQEARLVGGFQVAIMTFLVAVWFLIVMVIFAIWRYWRS